ncbi:MAG: hypothetical protein K8S97_13215 [Anaerolineae bacterium]|nr:hypothetical protein [Anaerolineae bacterium]
MDTLQLQAFQRWSDYSNEGVLAFDCTGRITLINTWLWDLLRLRAQPATVDALLKHTGTAIPELEDLLACDPPMTQTAWGHLRISNHSPQQVIWQRIPLFEDETPVGYVLIFRDAATHGQVELTRQSFLSMLSHDLRTPLSTILGFAELLRNNRHMLTEEEQAEFLEHIIKNANQLSRYSQIALDVMYLEANLQNFEMESVALGRFVKHWLRDAAHRLSADQLLFHNGYSEEPVAEISPAALHRILYILVEFALAESPEHEHVTIRLEFDDTAAHVIVNHHAPELDVADIPNLFRLMHPRDLSEQSRPQLHSM